jgi:NADPH-dependent glutamate synthase beta subunit-like oxidoreductase
MPDITIDGKSINVPEDATILDAAQALGIHIPTLCYLKETMPLTSCMICVVKVEGRGNLLPACATKVEDGMVVINDHPEVTKARRTALELLLSDHVGDCMGPCQVACPAGMDIPRMIRYMEAGRYDKAIEVIKGDIALPAVTGYICPAPCEKSCRRGQVDEPVAIRLLKRCAAELDLSETSPYRPAVSRDTGKKVAIVGSGPAGLAAAYYLQREGISCTIFDDREEPGGMLRYGVLEQDLPRSVLDAEIGQIQALGVVFKQQVHVGTDLTLEELLKTFDAVFLGMGNVKANDLEILGFDPGHVPLVVDKNTYQTDIPGVFAGGDMRRRLKLTVRSLEDGKKAAMNIDRFLKGETVIGSKRPFNSRMGKLEPEELAQLTGPLGTVKRAQTFEPDIGLTKEQAQGEASRCLHCDCRKADSCKLRVYAQEYEAKATHYRGKRRLFVRMNEHSDLIYEPGKCISCGICVRITEQQREKLGLTFNGRGFDVKVAVPFNQSTQTGLTKTANEVVKACPTGALAFK